MAKINRLQYLLITQLLSEGEVELLLPDGIELKVGITQEGKHGTEFAEDYCWITASQGDRTMSMDSYNLNLEFPHSKIVCENDFEDEEGQEMTFVEVV
jgi:hypothetical protein